MAAVYGVNNRYWGLTSSIARLHQRKYLATLGEVVSQHNIARTVYP
jgi:hypothetical protein